MPRKHITLTALALIAASLVASLAAMEVVLRLLGFSYVHFYRFDPVLGASLRPGAEGRFSRWQEVHVRVNRDGMRDRDHAEEKPPGTVRVAVLGDSFTEALHVAEKDAFWAVMERRMAACPAFAGRTVEALNFGVSGYGTAQELLMLRHRAWKYHPDIVLLAFLPGNDVRNNARALNKSDDIPYFRLEGDRLVLDDSFRMRPGWERAARLKNLVFAMTDHSRLAQLALKAYVHGKAARLEAREAEPAPRDRGRLFEVGLNYRNVFKAPADPRWHEAWRLTEVLLREADAEAERGGADFWLVVLTSSAQVYPDPAVRAEVMAELGVEDLSYPERRLRALGEREGIRVIGLGEPLRERAERDGVFLHGPDGRGHWNENGHRAAGEVIAERLCAHYAAAPVGG